MDLPIIIRFQWNAEELYQARRYHFRHACRPLFRWALYGLAVLLFIAGLLMLKNGREPVLGAAFVFNGIYWPFLRRYEQRWTARRQMARRPDKNLEVEWQVGAETICVSSELGKSEFSWRAVSKIVRTPVGLFLYPNDRIFHWLPRSGFMSDADFEEMVELARSKVSRYYLVN